MKLLAGLQIKLFKWSRIKLMFCPSQETASELTKYFSRWSFVFLLGYRHSKKYGPARFKLSSYIFGWKDPKIAFSSMKRKKKQEDNEWNVEMLLTFEWEDQYSFWFACTLLPGCFTIITLLKSTFEDDLQFGSQQKPDRNMWNYPHSLHAVFSWHKSSTSITLQFQWESQWYSVRWSSHLSRSLKTKLVGVALI